MRLIRVGGRSDGAEGVKSKEIISRKSSALHRGSFWNIWESVRGELKISRYAAMLQVLRQSLPLPQPQPPNVWMDR